MKKVFSFATIALFAFTMALTSCRNDAATQAPAATEPAAAPATDATAPAATDATAPAADTTKAQ